MHDRGMDDRRDEVGRPPNMAPDIWWTCRECGTVREPEQVAAGEAGELRQVRRHLPPLATQDAEPTGGGDEAAETIPFELVGVITRGERATAAEHRFRERSQTDGSVVRCFSACLPATWL